MKSYFSIVALLFPLFIGMSGTTTKTDFFTGSLSSARNKAANEGKLYFVEFSASWCGPCKWMDETVFNDSRVADYIEDNYIPVKVDIDDFDGYEYKQQYNVSMLPTFIIFNAEGKQLARYEESFAPSTFINTLKQYDRPENRTGKIIGAPTASTPSSVKPLEPAAPAPPKPTVSAPTPSKPAAPSTSTASASASGNLFMFDATPLAPTGYSIQVGVFAEYANVLRETARLKQITDESVVVSIAESNGKPVYKVSIGQYTTRSQAVGISKQLERKGVSGWVKSLQ